MFRFFVKSETGAISVDWTVLTAVAFSLGLITVWWAAGDADDRAAREMGVYFQEAPNGYGAFIPDAPIVADGTEEVEETVEEVVATNHAALFDFSAWTPMKLSQRKYDDIYDAAVNLTEGQLNSRIGNRFETLKDAIEKGKSDKKIGRSADNLAAFIAANEAAGHPRRADHDEMVRYLDQHGLISLPSDPVATTTAGSDDGGGFLDGTISLVSGFF